MSSSHGSFLLQFVIPLHTHTYVLSFCRTKLQRFNVAVTRSKALTVVVGHAAVLAADRYWRELLQYCIRHNMYRGMPCPLLRVEDELDHRDIFDKALGVSLGSYEQMFPQSLDDYYFLDDPGWKVM